jgi:hypothetical protein
VKLLKNILKNFIVIKYEDTGHRWSRLHR